MTYKILVVDDEPDLEPLVKQRMRRNIRSGEYSFVFAGNGVEALEKLDNDEDIDMVVSDINMPMMDGLTLLQQIPKVNPNIRSIIISAYGDMKNIRTAMNRGAFDFVTKPLDFEDLRVTIDRTLKHLEEWRAALRSRDALVALQNELDLAKSTQQSILPTLFPDHDRYSVFASMTPARNVGGDFYDVINLKDHRMGFAIADVSDKGVPAALFMMSSRTLLKSIALDGRKPGVALKAVNALLHEDNDAGMFVTLFYSVYDPNTGELVYANGGHNPPLLVRADGSSELLPLTGGIALGVAPGLAYRDGSITLQPGEALVFYTDGVTEAMNAEDELFDVERLQDIFAGGGMTSAEDATRAVFDAVRDYVGDTPQSDDITCLVLHRAEMD